MEYKKTQRGFQFWEFVDRYGKTCSVQESSLATEDAIWLGCSELEPLYFHKDAGPGWHELKPPIEGADVVGNNRMHLTKEQVKELIPILEHFVETGWLPKG